MKVKVAYKDGTFGEIPGVKWHPEFDRHVSQTYIAREPAGLWITEDELFAHLEAINAKRKELGVKPRPLSTPRNCHELISFAEAPFEIYTATSDGTPWKNNGTLVKTIHYGPFATVNDQFWDRR